MPSNSTSNRRALIVLFLTMFIVMVGFGVILPILPFYAENMGANGTALGFLFASYSIIQFFFAPVWGQISDRIGRKPPLLIGLLGFSLSFVLFGLATELWMLFAARILGGLLSAAVLPTVTAYIADTTDEEQRGSGMGILGAAMGMGVSFGPVIGGFLGEISPSLPFYFSAALATVVAVVMFFLLPESRPRETRSQASAGTRPWQGIRSIFGVLSGPLGFIMITAFLASFASANLEATFALFTEVGLGFGEREMGLVFGVMGVTMAVAQGVLVGPSIRRWGESRLIQFGLITSAIGYVLLLFGTDLTAVLFIMALLGLGNAALRPAITSLVSKRTPATEQGNMLGIVNAYNSLGRVFGPVTGGLIFDHIGYRYPYIFGAAMFLGTFLFSIPRFQRDRVDEKQADKKRARLVQGYPAADTLPALTDRE